MDDGWHIDIIKDKLMRSLGTVLPDLIDELLLAVSVGIPCEGDGESILIDFIVLHELTI